MTDYEKKYRNQFVRVAYLLMVISFVLTGGCATVSEKRYVENNTFISTYPKMAIKVSPEFQYVGEFHLDRYMQATFAMDKMDVKAQRVLYIFCQKGNDDNVKRGEPYWSTSCLSLTVGIHNRLHLKRVKSVRWTQEKLSSVV